MNTGAMWMNLETLSHIEPQFEAWTRANLERCIALAFDQGAFRVFFNPLHRACWKLGVPNSLFYAVMSRLPVPTWKWDDLPLELNWKPYWGENERASVVHFHGLKPTLRADLAAGTLLPAIAALDGPPFRAYAAIWDQWLEQANRL